MKPLRIAFVSADGFEGRGGIGRVGAYLRDALAQGHEDVVLVERRTRLSERGLFKHLTMPLALARFAVACAGGRYDIVHLNVARKGSTWRKRLFGQVAKAAGVPVLLHLHGSGYDGYYRSLNAPTQRAIRRFFLSADRIVALSDAWRDFLIRDMGLPADRIVVIHNGVRIPPAAAAPTGSPVSIAFLGLIGERKGVDVLIDALATLPDDLPDWRATIAGNGEIGWAKRLAEERGLSPRLDFPGWVEGEAVASILQAADLFVLPSRAENQPVAALEAMAHGVPVVASDAGALPEQVSHGETGLIVPAGEARPLADALAELVARPERRRAMGGAGRARAEAEYGIAASASRFAQLYRQLAGRA